MSFWPLRCKSGALLLKMSPGLEYSYGKFSSGLVVQVMQVRLAEVTDCLIINSSL